MATENATENIIKHIVIKHLQKPHKAAADYGEDDDERVEELLEDDEVSAWEAAFMLGYRKAEEEGFE